MRPTFKGYHTTLIPFDAMQEIQQLRFNAILNKRRLKEAYNDLRKDNKVKCPYCSELFTGYWARHHCDVHVRFDHEKENTRHVMAILSTFISLTAKHLEIMLESSPEYTYNTSLAGEEILNRPKWFNRLFLKHYDILTFIKENEGISLSELYQKFPKQKRRDNVLLKIFNLKMRHLIHSTETEREKTKRPLLDEVDSLHDVNKEE